MISGFGTTILSISKDEKKRKTKTKKKEVNERKLVVHLKQPKNLLNIPKKKEMECIFYILAGPQVHQKKSTTYNSLQSQSQHSAFWYGNFAFAYVIYSLGLLWSSEI